MDGCIGGCVGLCVDGWVDVHFVQELVLTMITIPHNTFIQALQYCNRSLEHKYIFFGCVCGGGGSNEILLSLEKWNLSFL